MIPKNWCSEKGICVSFDHFSYLKILIEFNFVVPTLGYLLWTKGLKLCGSPSWPSGPLSLSNLAH